MRNVNKICMSILMLGAAAFAAPALAQGDAKADAPEQAAAPDQSAANAPAQANPDSSAGPAAPAENTQTAMNSSSAAANANVSSVGDTSKKYHRATRGKDFAAEQKVTQQLNQMASNAAKPVVQTAINQ